MANTPYETKDMTGSLFKNENPKSEKSPPYTGTAKINGTMYRVSGFLNESKAGKKYFGLTFQEADGQHQLSSKPSSSDDGWL